MQWGGGGIDVMLETDLMGCYTEIIIYYPWCSALRETLNMVVIYFKFEEYIYSTFIF